MESSGPKALQFFATTVMVSESILKVLHICQRDSVTEGGAVRVAVEYVQRLETYNVDAHCLFVYGVPGLFKEVLKDRAHYLGLQNSKDIFRFHRLTKFINDFCPNIVHHHDSLVWTHALTFYHSTFLKVSHAHLDAVRYPIISKSRLQAYLQRQSTDLLIAISKTTRESFISTDGYLFNKINVLYNGVNTERFYRPSSQEIIQARDRFGLPIDKPVVGYVGRLHCDMKGTDDFIRILAKLPEDVWGLVVGSGSDLNLLQSLAADLGVQERIIFAGSVNDTVTAYHAMDIFCFTSHFEPFGLVVVEAMACNVPVIGFACKGGVTELLTNETGWVVSSRDLDKISCEIMLLISKREDCLERTEKALQQISKYHDWGRNTSLLATFYRQLLNK